MMQSLKQGMRKLFLKPFQPRNDLLAKSFSEDYAVFQKLKKIFKDKAYGKSNLRIYHPGCGSDMASIIMFMDAFLDDKTKMVEVICLDNRDFFEGLITQLKHYAPGAWFSYSNRKDASQVDVYYLNRKIRLIFYLSDANFFVPKEVIEGIDIYFERAFEIFRSGSEPTFRRILQNVRPNGLIISDYGFSPSEVKGFVKLKKIPKKFGLYSNLQIWQRKS